MSDLNDTHDPARRSWIASANCGDTDFPIQNLPYGVFSAGSASRHVGVAIGDSILDLTLLEEAGRIRPGGETGIFDKGELNAFMALGPEVWSRTRALIGDVLDKHSDPARYRHFIVPQAEASMHLPFFVRSFTDFYASREHATNVGSMFRGPDQALMPNWLHMPVGYNGRASTVVVSGTPVRRPNGQLKSPEEEAPSFGPCRKLDFELELGAIVGTPSAMGEMIPTARACEMIFGHVLLNDWSARDIQVWEYQPLGPFQSKAFATTTSPWVVTAEALRPFRHPTPGRIKPPLPYLEEDTPNNLDIHLEVDLTPADGRTATICRTNSKFLYYSAAQQLAHHASSGCMMCTGDLLGSGTISGAERESWGSMLELAWNGRHPIDIDGVTRGFIEDGDTVTLRGWCDGPYRLGFGVCSGTVEPAVLPPGAFDR